MATASQPLPWLENVRTQIENSQEWKDFTGKLGDAVQQQMNENHVGFFTDLSETEKTFILEKATRTIQGGDLYHALKAHISTCLEEQLYGFVAQEMQDGCLLKNKSELVMSNVRNGMMYLLEKRPDMKGKLHVLFNQHLPASLRRLIWRLYLSNTKTRMEYLSHVSMNKATSVLDREISLQCLSVLTSERTFQHLQDNKRFLCMSTLLYVWDQFILGLGQPAYNCLPALSVAFILLLQEPLAACQTTGEVEEVMRTQGPALSIQQFQNVISKYFFTSLYSTLNKEEHEPYPVRDSSQAVPLWSHLSRAPQLPRTRPQDRRQAREEREMLRRQRTERQKMEESLRRNREEEQKRQEESRLQRLLEETRHTFTVQRDQLLEQLSQEQQFHYETQKAADEQIKGLQAAIRRLLEQRRLSMDAYSVRSLVVPPPSVDSQASSQTWHPFPSSLMPADQNIWP
ncbi:uncharacterized protein LOC115096549 isoform X5 [Rhinatrema bivittatum]|uniref:uncharacterized protein LOC115096549 isoform X5 n=1 Tax=Rhinatrema bivittatum TaxID=194408 RepID=UPI00112C2A38|nr:uncharacterized protein LOC115096549 isoform X5 [Rhinatrema bivittatum]